MKPLVLKKCFEDPLLDVMNFLNQIVSDYPAAISFAPGRPMEEWFDVEARVTCLTQFVNCEARRLGIEPSRVWNDLGQYNRTNGSINSVIAAQLLCDEGMQVKPESVMVTVGAQEAMAVILGGIFDPKKDILLVSDPTYVGITGLARIFGIRTLPVALGPEGLTPDEVSKAIMKASAQGRPRALYDIPDFNNPLGVSLPLARRLELLKLCSRHDLLYLEDNPYGMFAYDDRRLPTLKSLDQDGTVIYIGSYSKTLFPGLRVGYLVADQIVEGAKHTLAEELSKIKSLITVNTSGICQGIVASTLSSCSYSLESIIAPKRAQMRRNRDLMIGSLEKEFADCCGVEWNRPHGGFFLTLQFPFEFGNAELERCAANYGVIVCPMNFLSLSNDRRTSIRLSFSYVNERQIVQGVQRLAQFYRDHAASPAPPI